MLESDDTRESDDKKEPDAEAHTDSGRERAGDTDSKPDTQLDGESDAEAPPLHVVLGDAAGDAVGAPDRVMGDPLEDALAALLEENRPLSDTEKLAATELVGRRECEGLPLVDADAFSVLDEAPLCVVQYDALGNALAPPLSDAAPLEVALTHDVSDAEVMALGVRVAVTVSDTRLEVDTAPEPLAEGDELSASLARELADTVLLKLPGLDGDGDSVALGEAEAFTESEFVGHLDAVPLNERDALGESDGAVERDTKTEGVVMFEGSVVTIALLLVHTVSDAMALRQALLEALVDKDTLGDEQLVALADAENDGTEALAQGDNAGVADAKSVALVTPLKEAQPLAEGVEHGDELAEAQSEELKDPCDDSDPTGEALGDSSGESDDEAVALAHGDDERDTDHCAVALTHGEDERDADRCAVVLVHGEPDDVSLMDASALLLELTEELSEAIPLRDAAAVTDCRPGVADVEREMLADAVRLGDADKDASSVVDGTRDDVAAPVATPVPSAVRDPDCDVEGDPEGEGETRGEDVELCEPEGDRDRQEDPVELRVREGEDEGVELAVGLRDADGDDDGIADAVELWERAADALADNAAVGLNDTQLLADGLECPDAERFVDGEDEEHGDMEPAFDAVGLCDVDAESVSDAVVDTTPVGVTLDVAVNVWDADSVLLALEQGVALEHCDPDGEPLSVLAEVNEAVSQRERDGDTLDVAEALGQRDAAPELDAVNDSVSGEVAVTDAVAVGTTLGSTVTDDDALGQLDRDGEPLADRDDVNVREGEGEVVAVRGGVSVADKAPVLEPEDDADGHGDADKVADASAVGEMVSEDDVDTLAHRDTEAEPVEEPLALGERVVDAENVFVTAADGDGLALWHDVAAVEALGDMEEDGDALSHADTLGEVQAEAPLLGVKLTEGLLDKEGEMENAPLELWHPVAVKDKDGGTLTVADALAHADTLCEAQSERPALGVADTRPERVADAEGDADREALLLAVSRPLELTVAANVSDELVHALRDGE